MKRLTHSRSAVAMIFAGLFAVSLARAAEDVVSPAKRQASLVAAKELFAAKEVPATPANPFYSAAFEEALAASSGRAAPAAGAESSTGSVAPSGPRSGREILQTIAMSLKPRYLEVGGKPILFFGQKRVNPGGSLTINFEGTDYVLEIVSIDRPNFTLRLNREEFTRPIK